jgi:DamX protein
LSELQERLKHLINYSSQLIFVSGDTIAQQQRSLEDFLSIQQENTEISYFTAEMTMESPDLRRTICRQLLGVKLGSFNRPLKQLLKNLHQQPGPFLLCIKQAQMLPNDFLQELWEWVCESKKLSESHHVNVILFGETEWAEKAKKWLPKKNKNRPVLLSSQSVSSVIDDDASQSSSSVHMGKDAHFDIDALEILLSDPSLNRKSPLDENSPPLVSQKWFISCVLCLLLVVFVGLMTWQYPEQVKHFLSTGQLEPKESIVKDELAEVNRALDKAASQARQNDTLASPTEEVTALPVEPSAQPPEELVTSWKDAKQASESNIEELRSQIAAENVEAEATNVKAETNIEEQSGDFAVPDIISVEQLDAKLGESLLQQQSSASSDARETATSAIEESVNEGADINPPPLSFTFDEAEILAIREPAVMLQLSGIQNRSVLDEFITDNQLKQQVWVYETTRYGGSWHVVLLNRSFDDVGSAREALNLLPENIQAMQPFAKDLRQIKREISSKQ